MREPSFSNIANDFTSIANKPLAVVGISFQIGLLETMAQSYLRRVTCGVTLLIAAIDTCANLSNNHNDLY